MRVLRNREWDMLEALLHLRYLATAQLHAVWYERRTANACLTRLSRLHNAEILGRMRLQDQRWPGAWHLGRVGLRLLEERTGEDLQLHVHLTPQFIPHLLETNEVLLSLAPRGWAWATLPFGWAGSHRCGLTFTEVRRDGSTGATRRRNRLLRPDAVILARGVAGGGDGADPSRALVGAGRRVFLELDRATESVVSRAGRTSIEGKLRAYRAFLFGRADEGGTWYERAFCDGLPPSVLFVVPPSPGQSRRQRSIEALVARGDARVARLVACCPANDLSWLRSAVYGAGSSGEGDARPSPHESALRARPAGGGHHLGAAELGCRSARPDACILSRAEVTQLQSFFRISLEAYRRLHPESSVRTRFKAAAVHAKKALERFPAVQRERCTAAPDHAHAAADGGCGAPSAEAIREE